MKPELSDTEPASATVSVEATEQLQTLAPVPRPLGRVTPTKVIFALIVVALTYVSVVHHTSSQPSNVQDTSSPYSTGANVAPPAVGSPAPTARPTVPEQPPLELVKFAWRTEYGYAILEGQVKNISSQPLRDVTAVASFYDANGGFITSADTLIAYNPVLPGQTSPFKVMATENPAMHKAGVQFKELLGGAISFRRAEDTGRKGN